MFNVGGGEILAILVIALIVLGPDKLPNAARQAGKYLNEFRRISSGFQDEIRGAMDLATTTDPTPVQMDPAEPAIPVEDEPWRRDRRRAVSDRVPVAKTPAPPSRPQRRRGRGRLAVTRAMAAP
jgi:sec-independent protein translocase protein TatB